MSLKFKVSDWKFELTWRELSCAPVDIKADNKKAETDESIDKSAWKSAGYQSNLTTDTKSIEPKKAARGRKAWA